MTTTSECPSLVGSVLVTRPVRIAPRPRPGASAAAASSASSAATVRATGGTVLPLHAYPPVRAARAVRRPAGRPVEVVDRRAQLHAHESVAASSAVQLTRRGWVLLLGLTAVVTAVLLAVAALSQPAAQAAHPVAAGAAAPAHVVVHAGDTLWSIAGRVAPTRDPRAVVDELQQRNHLTSVVLVPGQVLRVA